MKKRTKIFLLILSGLLLAAMLYLFLSSQSRFLHFCDQFFIEEMETDPLTMHYTIENPGNYGIECTNPSLGSIDLDAKGQKRWLKSKYLTLKTIFRSQLSSDLQRLYDSIKYSLHIEMEGVNYTLFQEPLVPSIGMQSQLPILLAEYSLNNETDITNYLTLLKCIPEYFDSILTLEEAKIAEGLFMDEVSAEELITYCREFCQTPESHFLIKTFQERLFSLNLDPQKNSNYLQEHSTILNDVVFPSYQKLQDFLEKNKQAGQNNDGLFYYPNGTDYYDWLLRSEVGISHSFEELETLLDKDLKKNAGIIAKLLKTNPKLLEERQCISLDTSNPAGLTLYLSKRASADFPKIPEVDLKICEVPSSMEPHLSPAFYLVSPIDCWEENVVYLNQSCLKEGISFFTTLAHESYPGHLYQTIYENSNNPHPLQRLLYFGGYSEGWATYAEQLSYYYAPISESMAKLLSTTRAMNLNLYSHLDLYVHAYGWTEDDCKAYLKKFGITGAGSVHDMFMLVKQQPANYLKYYLGYLEICHLKEQARDCLGSAFNLKEFHEFILTYGPAPFPLLETYLKDWLIEQQKGFSELENP